MFVMFELKVQPLHTQMSLISLPLPPPNNFKTCKGLDDGVLYEWLKKIVIKRVIPCKNNLV